MGRNSQRRRAARQRARARPGQERRAPTGGRDPFGSPAYADSADAYALAATAVHTALRRLGRRRCGADELRRTTELLLRRLSPIPILVPAAVLGVLLESLVARVVAGGWSTDDLAELVARHAGVTHVPTLMKLLREHADRDGAARHGGPRGEGTDRPLILGTVDTLASGLRIAALLQWTPVLEPAAAGRATSVPPAAAHPKLARVRALLAKAESTPYPEEAEALSAKAQELITRYALEQLVAQTEAGAGEGLTARRIWLDAPYVGAKAALVHEVASANRCRSASCEQLGFCVVVGSDADLHAVELLVTSLLVQADVALLGHARRTDRSDASRTRSFRRSFLLAYATRIGERLRATATDTVDAVAAQAATEVATGAGPRLPDLVRDHEDRVAEAFEAMMPHVSTKASTASNAAGWTAGTVAADLASLDVHDEISDRAG